jgi:hypothetical protein
MSETISATWWPSQVTTFDCIAIVNRIDGLETH